MIPKIPRKVGKRKAPLEILKALMCAKTGHWVLLRHAIVFSTRVRPTRSALRMAVVRLRVGGWDIEETMWRQLGKGKADVGLFRVAPHSTLYRIDPKQREEVIKEVQTSADLEQKLAAWYAGFPIARPRGT